MIASPSSCREGPGCRDRGRPQRLGGEQAGGGGPPLRDPPQPHPGRAHNHHREGGPQPALLLAAHQWEPHCDTTGGYGHGVWTAPHRGGPAVIQDGECRPEGTDPVLEEWVREWGGGGRNTPTISHESGRRTRFLARYTFKGIFRLFHPAPPQPGHPSRHLFGTWDTPGPARGTSFSATRCKRLSSRWRGGSRGSEGLGE